MSHTMVIIGQEKERLHMMVTRFLPGYLNSA